VVTSAGRTPGGGELDVAGGSRGGRASGREGRQRPNLLGAAARRLGGDGGMGKTCETTGELFLLFPRRGLRVRACDGRFRLPDHVLPKLLLSVHVYHIRLTCGVRSNVVGQSGGGNWTGYTYG
jgi:hypothetical protein